MPTGFEMPMIRLEVDRMKYQIMAAIHEHHGEIEAEIERQLNIVLENNDYIPSAVERGVKDALEREIKLYFQFGSGREAIKDAVYAALDEVFKKDEEEVDHD